MSTKLDGDAVLTWKLNQNMTELNIWLNVKGTEWMAAGWSASGLMKDTVAIIYRPENDMTTASQYQISGYDLPSQMSASTKLTMTTPVNVWQQQPSGDEDSDNPTTTELSFGVKLDDFVKSSKFVFAVGSHNTFAHHEYRGAVSVDWMSGTGQEIHSGGIKQWALYAHGILMILGWSLLFPVGILFSRFGRECLKTNGRWFKLHRAVQSLGLVATCVALIVMIAYHHGTDEDHFSTTHGKVGLALMIVAVCQPLNALLRPHPKPKTTPRLVWEVVHKTCGYASVVIAAWNAFGGLESEWWSEHEDVHDDLLNVLRALVVVVCFSVLCLLFSEARALGKECGSGS